MNGQHFRAFLWLRWRLFVNQLTRGGIAGKIFLIIAAISVAMLTVAFVVLSFLAGFFLLPETKPIIVLIVWDGVVIFFLFSWLIGLMAELQRSEAFSLDKFLHLPVSLSGVFTLNYLSSLVCLTIVLCVPAMAGLALGLTLGKGPALALQVPLAVSFIFMVTALTYQFQGWLASLMVNKRRRRTIIVVVTLAFILIFQLPNLLNIFKPWQGMDDEAKEKQATARKELDRAFAAKEITAEEVKNRRAEIQRDEVERGKEKLRWWEETAWTANMVLPIGWLPWGSAALMEGNVFPALGATLAYALIGGASLWRAYRTTLRMYTGQFTAGAKTPAAPVAPTEGPTAPTIPVFLERKIPLLSEQAAVIALTGFRSLLRAPEVKMMLLSPIIMVVIFGGMFMRGGVEVPQTFRPLIIYGAMSMILFTLTQLAGNQFAFDRSGFRIFVLSPAPRRDILLGKNMAIAPLVTGLTAPVVILLAIVMPLRLDHLLAVPFQFASMFLIYCMSANLMSIWAPLPVASGSLKPLSPKMVPMLLHMVFVFALPMVMAPVLFPWGIEAGLEALDWSGGVPIALPLTLLEFAAIVGLYRVVVRWEGDMLQAREQKILDVVVAKAE